MTIKIRWEWSSTLRERLILREGATDSYNVSERKISLKTERGCWVSILSCLTYCCQLFHLVLFQQSWRAGINQLCHFFCLFFPHSFPFSSVLLCIYFNAVWGFFFKYLFGCSRSSLQHAGFLVGLLQLRSPMACGILGPWLGIEPTSPAFEGRFLTIGPPRKS